MNYTKTKNTRRFKYEINRNDTAKKAGSNTVSISTNSDSDGYSAGTTSLTMTVREAVALQGFLNDSFSSDYVSDSIV